MAAKKTQAIIILALLVAGCAPAQTTVPTTQILPTPLARVTHAGTAVPTEAPSTPTPPAQIPIPKSDIQKMADELYGVRQIGQISIPTLSVESNVIPVGWRIQFAEELQGSEFEWDSPGADVGWVITSVLPDETGNVILYGHNNLYGRVFEHLADLTEGDKIYLQTGTRRWEYEARYVLLLPITGASEKQVETYQQYLQPTQDERLTLISCWPPVSNTHRVVVIAFRVSKP
jgi:sortase A